HFALRPAQADADLRRGERARAVPHLHQRRAARLPRVDRSARARRPTRCSARTLRARPPGEVMQNGYPRAAIVLAYLLGSVSFAILVSRTMGLADPRSYGSRNPVATNVLRSGNRIAAALTLLGDGAKGWVAVALARTYGPRWGLDEGTIALVALAVFV